MIKNTIPLSVFIVSFIYNFVYMFLSFAFWGMAGASNGSRPDFWKDPFYLFMLGMGIYFYILFGVILARLFNKKLQISLLQGIAVIFLTLPLLLLILGLLAYMTTRR